MRLRNLQIEDVPLMMEWMGDPYVYRYLEKDFQSMTEADCLEFISKSASKNREIHMAVVDEKNIYQGTVSLKKIPPSGRSAEFAIVMRKSAMGQGYAKDAMKNMLRIGKQRNLRYVYWYVSDQNIRALRFYSKNGYKEVSVNEIKSLRIENDMERILKCKTIRWFLERLS